MSILDRIRQLFSSENLTQQETSADASRADGPDLGLWLDDGYRAMRSRHEWLINGQEGRPWRLYHGARERGTVAQMIERYSHLSIPKNALATVWDGKKWTFHPILDAAYADVMPDFSATARREAKSRLGCCILHACRSSSQWRFLRSAAKRGNTARRGALFGHVPVNNGQGCMGRPDSKAAFLLLR